MGILASEVITGDMSHRFSRTNVAHLLVMPSLVVIGILVLLSSCTSAKQICHEWKNKGIPYFTTASRLGLKVTRENAFKTIDDYCSSYED